MPGTAGSRRSAFAHARRGAAFCPRLDLQGHAVARGAECRAAVGAAQEAARERARRALAARARPLPRSSIPSSAARSSTRPANGSATRRAGRSAAARRCSARTPRRCSASVRAGAAERAGTAAQGREPAPLGIAQQAVPAAGHQDFRLRVVSRLGRRHAVSRGDGRGELQGRVEGQSRHAAGGNGAGRRPRRARCGDRAAARGQGPRHGRQFSQQELRQARHLAQHPPPQGACRSPRT